MVDVGVCVHQISGQLKELLCLDGIRNYCCTKSNSTSIIFDGESKRCCTLEEYLDAQWATLGSISGLMLLIAIYFLSALLVALWIYIFSASIHESHVQKSGRIIIDHMLKNQILKKSKRHIPSLYTSLKEISKSLSNSRKRKELERQRQQATKMAIKSPDNRRETNAKGISWREKLESSSSMQGQPTEIPNGQRVDSPISQQSNYKSILKQEAKSEPTFRTIKSNKSHSSRIIPYKDNKKIIVLPKASKSPRIAKSVMGRRSPKSTIRASAKSPAMSPSRSPDLPSTISPKSIIQIGSNMSDVNNISKKV